MLSSHGIPAKGGTCLGRMDDNIHPGASRETPLVILSEASVAVRRNPAHAAGFYLTKPSYPSIFKSMIDLKKVSYEYKLDDKQSILALDDINLTFEKGKSVAIIGSNGSGKTTLARLLNALLLPSSGQVMVDGLDTQDKDSQKLIRLKVGMVFQNPDNQLISTSVEREIAFGLENLALPYEEMGKRVRWALYFFHLKEYMNYPPHKLSGGEKQRVALASVLSMQPEYLVLDEPTSLLDPKGKKEVLSLIRKLTNPAKRGDSPQKDVTVIHITQFPEETILADRVLVMHKGRIVLEGTPQDVFKQKEKLRKIGLQAPLAFELAWEFSQRGVIPSGDYLTMDDLIEKLPSNIKSVKRKPAPKTNQINLEFAHPVPNFKISPNGNGSKNIESSSSNSPFQILIENLSFIYNQGLPTQRKALDGINLQIKKGDFIGLVGPTGSGKTTLVQHLNALFFPTSGRVILEGVDLSARFKGKDKSVDLRKIRQKAGLVFQFPELQLFEDTVYDDIAFGPKNLGLIEEKVKERVQSSMFKVGLDFDEFALRSPFSLSGGEQRKVAIAGVLAQEPEVLILDEPTCGLDSKSTEEIKKLLTDLNTNGVTVILISHNMDLIAELAQKIILLNQGRVVSFCRKEDFFKDSEKLKSIGLDLPKVIEFVWRLREKGIKIEQEVFTEEELVNFVDGLFRKQKT
jgi:energy-coupling factor transporter ATPase